MRIKKKNSSFSCQVREEGRVGEFFLQAHKSFSRQNGEKTQGRNLEGDKMSRFFLPFHPFTFNDKSIIVINFLSLHFFFHPLPNTHGGKHKYFPFSHIFILPTKQSLSQHNNYQKPSRVKLESNINLECIPSMMV